ncbi:hypothetical protein AV903_03895 [Erwinia tracheiphila]|uniref:Uncharacterized protein n=1 Tax=Erwinia tracheiphila TaxID=65700 RepID=A0A345CPS5_9GAMM|nr:hypothetical protein AV903_03895 [Erwinia tracheiphila]
MVKSLAVMGITDSDFPMSSMTGRASLLLTTSTGGGVHAGIKSPGLAGAVTFRSADVSAVALLVLLLCGWRNAHLPSLSRQS